jgi:hypothetical protein
MPLQQIKSAQVSDLLPGITVEGLSTNQLNYRNNSAVNVIERATTSANVWSNTISGGGNITFPNMIRGDTSLRTICGGYDNIIGRAYASFPGDGNATIATQILGGAHNRIFLNGSADQVPTAFAVNTGTIQPSHGTITGGSYHQIRNGDYGIIGGGTNCVIQEIVAYNDYASGTGAVIAGGFLNEANGNYCVIGGGNTNTVENVNSVVGGGLLNSITQAKDSTPSPMSANVIGGGSTNTINCASSATIGGGQLNAISSGSGTTSRGLAGVIAGGYNNSIGSTAASTYAVVSGGSGNKANTHYTAIVGGSDNEISGQWSVGCGQQAKTGLWGALTQGGGQTTTKGDAQSSVIVLKRTTTNATTTVLFTQGNLLFIPSATTWAFRCMVVGRTAGGVAGAFEIKGAIHTGAIIGTPTSVSMGADAGAATWTATGNYNANTLEIRVTGAAATTINWVGRLELTEVTF